MAKSRNRSRDAKKRAKRKRMNRERLLRRELEVRTETSRLMDLAATLPEKISPDELKHYMDNALEEQ